jgi:hypothetical protein
MACGRQREEVGVTSNERSGLILMGRPVTASKFRRLTPSRVHCRPRGRGKVTFFAQLFPVRFNF